MKHGIDSATETYPPHVVAWKVKVKEHLGYREDGGALSRKGR